jgi:hypothetical protein
MLPALLRKIRQRQDGRKHCATDQQRRIGVEVARYGKMCDSTTPALRVLPLTMLAAILHRAVMLASVLRRLCWHHL